MEDELAPLVIERLIYNVVLLYNNVGDKSLGLRYIIRKLHSKTYKELASIANISTTS
jgi:hypothetical protein